MQVKRTVALLVLTSMISGCGYNRVKLPQRISETMSPTYPVRTVTGFTEALTCMDRLFLAQKVEPIYVTAAPIPDYSENRGGAGYGARDMMLSAILEMTRESAAIRFVAFDRSTPDIVALQASHPRKGSLRVPDFFIRGAVTQINTAPYSKQAGASMNIGELSKEFKGAGLSRSNSVSLASVSLDLGLGLISNYQMLPGMFSSNTFHVQKRGNSSELSVSLNKVGAVLNNNESESEALSKGLRALVEVGTIELFGKLYNLPYWNCLAMVGEENPEQQEALGAYRKGSESERRQYIFGRLQKLGMIPAGAAMMDGKALSLAFRQAIMRYRSVNNLLGGPAVDGRLYERLWLEEKTRPQQITGAITPSTISPNSTAARTEAPAAAPAAPAASAPASAPAPAPANAGSPNAIPAPAPAPTPVAPTGPSAERAQPNR